MLWQNFAINQNGCNGKIIFIWGKLRNILFDLWGKSMGKIYGKNLVSNSKH